MLRVRAQATDLLDSLARQDNPVIVRGILRDPEVQNLTAKFTGAIKNLSARAIFAMRANAKSYALSVLLSHSKEF